jgi:hypothetical protein
VQTKTETQPQICYTDYGSRIEALFNITTEQLFWLRVEAVLDFLPKLAYDEAEYFALLHDGELILEMIDDIQWIGEPELLKIIYYNGEELRIKDSQTKQEQIIVFGDTETLSDLYRGSMVAVLRECYPVK